MKKLFCFAVFSVVGLFVSPLFAGLTDPTELGVQVGYLVIEGDSNLKSAFVYGGRFGTYLTDHTSLEFSLLTGQSDIRGTNKSADLLLPTLEGFYYFGQDQWRPYLGGGAGVLQANRDRTVDRNQIDFALSYGGGVKYYWRPYCVARGDVRYIIDTQSGTGTNNALVSLGLSWLYGGSVETAPVKKKQKAMVLPTAPAKSLDSDHDGVPDDIDRCPDTPINTPVNSVGCPLDSDHDGVTDDKDNCPDTPYGMKVDAHGCPIAQDSDNDGVPDDKDDCPGTPAGTKVGPDGCPEESKVVPQANWVLPNVTFENNADKLTSNKHSELDDAIEILKTHTKVRVEIQGHTDSSGKHAHNQELSERRAQSVKDYLVQNGIAADRLEVKGYGETEPIATNTTSEGRAKNRRIEFKVLSK